MMQETEDQAAEKIMVAQLPDAGERLFVLKQLVETMETAEAAVPGSCAVTLFQNGFRLNVGQVEALVFMDGVLRVNLHGSAPLSDKLKPFLQKADYKSVSQPQFAYVGTVLDFRLWKPYLLQSHVEFVKLATLSPSGKPRKGSPFKKSHSPGLMAYARRINPAEREPDHFIAYHSARVMEGDYESNGELRFFSSKVGLLHKAVGNRVWVVNGSRWDRGTRYTLCGVYTATSVEPMGESYLISGEGKEFLPPIPLNECDWFPAFLRSQSNFSLGFNRVRDPLVTSALMAFDLMLVEATPEACLPDLDLQFSASEGSLRLVSHLRRERDKTLVKAKKASAWNRYGRLACEACGFDFATAYGKLGEGFCEVHHRVPLASAKATLVTTLDDLAVLCSNCHRVIHRTDPMLSVEGLATFCTL